MALLSGVLLRHLQLDRFVGAAQAAEQRGSRGGALESEWPLLKLNDARQAGEQRGSRFAHLEIDWTILNLNDDVVVEGAVEGMEIVVGRFRAIVFQFVPVEVMVVNKRSIEHDAAVRLESARNHIGGVGRRSAVGGGTEASLGIGLHDR